METSPDYKTYKDAKINSDLTKSLTDLRTISGNTMDLNIMNVMVSGVPCAVVTIEGMVSTSSMAELVFRPLMNLQAENAEKDTVFDFLTTQSLLAAERKTVFTYGDVFQFLFSGFAVIFIDGLSKAVVFGIQGYDKRSVSPPDSEQTIYGARDSFTEVIRTNISLIRRRMKTPTLRFEMLQAGELSSTDVCILYLRDRAAPEMVQRIRSKISKIKLDTVLNSGYIEPFLDDSYEKSIFSSIAKTERPDMVCAKLNQGKVCVLIDGTPFCLICPTLFVESFQTMDDYIAKGFYANFIRWIKYFAFFLAVLFPGLYVALVMFHPEFFTLKILLNLSASEEATPYPLVIEVIVLMLMFEVMREAGLRMPTSIGSAVSIVGSLIIGDAAVKSGIVSAPLLIVVGITATSSFAIPNLNQAVPILRLLFILAGGCAGLFGISVCLMMLLANVGAMNDFYIPYTAPLAPFHPKGAKDIFAREQFRSYEKEHSTIEDYRTNN